MQVLGRALRVDHKHDYQVPKEHGDEDELTKQLREHGCAPSLVAKSTCKPLLRVYVYVCILLDNQSSDAGCINHFIQL